MEVMIMTIMLAVTSMMAVVTMLMVAMAVTDGGDGRGCSWRCRSCWC